MCQVVNSFVKQNLQELKDDTKAFFNSLPGKQSVGRYALSLSRKFQPADVAQIYLFARACNAHTHVHFQNCTWSTVHDDLAYYVALDLATVGTMFVPLHSLYQEKMECVIGQVQVLVDPVVLGYSLEECDEDTDVSSDDSLSVDAWNEDVHVEYDDEVVTSTQPCLVPVTLLPLSACIQLCARNTVQLE